MSIIVGVKHLRNLIVVAAILCARANAQGLITQRNMSLDMAKTIAEATIGECKSKGFHTAAVVVDRGGQVLVMLRHEMATPQTAEMARRKAYTAVMFRSTTLEVSEAYSRRSNTRAATPGSRHSGAGWGCAHPRGQGDRRRSRQRGLESGAR